MMSADDVGADDAALRAVAEVERRIEAWIRHGEAVPADVTTYDRWIVHDELRQIVPDARAALAAVPRPVTQPECACPPCPGRGNDGHRMTHCAECCFGTGVEADEDCPKHGRAAFAPPSQPAHGAALTERRIYFDTEFIEDGRTIDLLSIGMVRADGATYYAEPAETDRGRASEWVQENVLPHLTGPVKPRAQIAAELVEFAGESPEFWAWYADYDWVALCQLFGTMMDLPDGWPMFCRDLRQVTDGATLPKQDAQDGPEHHALSDARWLTRAADRLAAQPAHGDKQGVGEPGVKNPYPGSCASCGHALDQHNTAGCYAFPGCRCTWIGGR